MYGSVNKQLKIPRVQHVTRELPVERVCYWVVNVVTRRIS